MTETHATASSGAPIFPPGRYGRRREPRQRRPVLLALVALVALAAVVGITVKLFQQYGNPQAAATVTRFYDITDTGISVDFVVNKGDDELATCLVRARDKGGDEVGAANVEAGEGEAVTVTYRLATKGRPVTVEVVRCTVEQ